MTLNNKLWGKSSLMVLSLILFFSSILFFFNYEDLWVSVLLSILSVGFAMWCLKNYQGPFEIVLASITGATCLMIILCSFIGVTSEQIEILFENLLLPCWDWIALAVSLISLVFVACTWISQEKTQKNTMRISPEIQKDLLIDIFRHSYRNIMVLYAVEARLKDHLDTHYPSEEHIQKLKVNNEAIYPEAFVYEPVKCRVMENFKLNLRNTNIEIDVITDHLKDPNMHIEIKRRDLQLLKKRIEYVIKRTDEVIKDLWGEKHKDIINSAIEYVDEKAAVRNTEIEEFEQLMNRAYELLDKGELYPFYTSKDSEFTKVFFCNKELEIHQFLRKLNANIYAMINSQGRICLIPYNNTDSIG